MPRGIIPLGVAGLLFAAFLDLLAIEARQDRVLNELALRENEQEEGYP